MKRNFQFNKVKHNPGVFFKTPEELLRDRHIGREDKLAILLSWRYDAIELEVASSEGMSGKIPSNLSEVSRAILKLH